MKNISMLVTKTQAYSFALCVAFCLMISCRLLEGKSKPWMAADVFLRFYYIFFFWISVSVHFIYLKCQSYLVKSLEVLWSQNGSVEQHPCVVLKGYFLHEHLRVHWSLVSVCWKMHWHFTWMEKPSSIDSLSLLFRFQVIIPAIGDHST